MSMRWITPRRRLSYCSSGQLYRIPLDHENPAIDSFTHVNNWVEHMQSCCGRALTDEDYLFPPISSTSAGDIIKFGHAMSYNGVDTLLQKIVEGSGVLKGRSGKFTTHCFRRGAAQWFFMFVNPRWPLKAVKWWGGWAPNEKVSSNWRAVRCTSLANFLVLTLICFTSFPERDGHEVSSRRIAHA